MNEFGGQRSDRVVVRADDPLSATVGDEAVLLDSDEGVYWGMNDVGKLLWDHLESPTRLSDLVAALQAEYDIDEETARTDLETFLDDLAGANLIEVRAPRDDP